MKTVLSQAVRLVRNLCNNTGKCLLYHNFIVRMRLFVSYALGIAEQELSHNSCLHFKMEPGLWVFALLKGLLVAIFVNKSKIA